MPIDTIELSELPKNSVSEEIFKTIKQKILNESWKKGDKLPPEGELCKVFNVSRVSVRSALKKLQGESLIITRHGKGSYVANLSNIAILSGNINKMELSKSEYEEMIEYRRAIEFRAIELAVDKDDRVLIENIRLSLEKMKANKLNLKNYVHYDVLFHLAIVKASKNDLFFEVFYNFRHILYKCFLETSHISFPKYGKEWSIRNHTEIYNSIASGDSESAKAVIEASIERNLNYYENKFK
jgi:GntR family transcriptional regulator, transcriptional repressor for pyruvate dehydrogenase complex